MKKLSACILLILLAFDLSAQPVMQWYTSHWPPYRISEGPYAGQGSFDLMLSQLVSALPQYKHQINQIHLARIVKVSATSSEDHCTFGLRYTPERDKRTYFSQPAGMLPNLAINSLQQNDRLSTFSPDQAIQMNQLVKDPDLLGLIENDRAYPAAIAAQINKEGSNLGGSSMSTLNPAQLLAAKRVDYVVDYPNRLRYFSIEAGQDVKLEFRPIAEIPSYSYTYVSCSKTGTGKRWISDIDKALNKLKLQPEYKRAMYRWFSEQEQQLLEPHYDGFQHNRLFVPEQAETRFSDL
ncbi:TIGR02285 family protein [Rheinheimera sp.]|uniref:TIGR02285 family protein n=1 Tax=Rheinheimera sp. TaxID=1869214 RepID=UPI0026284103|nr:TIGR02285 family protein [Rheinheimera sp.]MCA1931377.1 TIGR02285 family protein [Rheinheimera sp.]